MDFFFSWDVFVFTNSVVIEIFVKLEVTEAGGIARTPPAEFEPLSKLLAHSVTYSLWLLTALVSVSTQYWATSADYEWNYVAEEEKEGTEESANTARNASELYRLPGRNAQRSSGLCIVLKNLNAWEWNM